MIHYQWSKDIVADNTLPYLVVFISCLWINEPAVVVKWQYTAVLISTQTTHRHHIRVI